MTQPAPRTDDVVDRFVDVVVPAYGRTDLVDLVLDDLETDRSAVRRRVTVVDNLGEFTHVRPGVQVVRSPRNLRWIGTVNWALRAAAADGVATCVVLNSDVRLADPFLEGLVDAIEQNEGVAIAAPCYDDYWPHQHARHIPPTAAQYAPRRTVRDVPFCDGAAIAFDLAKMNEIGLLDEQTFDRHGYGADIDIAIRARRAGYRVVVTEACYVSHARHSSMPAPGVDVRAPREEIERGLSEKYGDAWRTLVRLPDSSLRPDGLSATEDPDERTLTGA